MGRSQRSASVAFKLLCYFAAICFVLQNASFLDLPRTLISNVESFQKRTLRRNHASWGNSYHMSNGTDDLLNEMESHIKSLEDDIDILRTKLQARDDLLEKIGKLIDDERQSKHATKGGNADEQDFEERTLLRAPREEITSLTNKSSSSPYAYAFLFGPANPENFSSYRGYLYNVLIATKILREQGSTADIVLWVRISAKSSATELPQQQREWLDDLGIRVRYLPKSKIEVFQDIIMEKFRILSMTEYRRVLFLDSDLMPLGNLDYFFELSDGPDAILKENMILAGRNVPMCAGFFMFAPKEGDYERAQQIMQEKYLDAYHKGINNDPILGWGHEIKAPDFWKGKFAGTNEGNNWTWYGSEVDQGFGYHWPKYEKKSVSILLNNKFENWGSDEAGNPTMLNWAGDPFQQYRRPILEDQVACRHYLCDHKHFDARSKPWMLGPPKDVDYTNPSHVEETRLKGTYELWFSTLYSLDRQYSMGVNFTHWEHSRLMPTAFDWNRGMIYMNTRAAVQAGVADEEELNSIFQ